MVGLGWMETLSNFSQKKTCEANLLCMNEHGTDMSLPGVKYRACGANKGVFDYVCF